MIDPIAARLTVIARQNREIAARMIQRRSVQWTMTRHNSEEVLVQRAKKRRRK
jgi:hypothetical protein